MARCGHCMEITGGASAIIAHQKRGCAGDPRWREVMEARLTGHDAAADRIARRLLGVVEPMSEEAKVKLREYNETHKEEIKRRRQIQATIRKGLKAKLTVKRNGGGK